MRTQNLRNMPWMDEKYAIYIGLLRVYLIINWNTIKQFFYCARCSYGKFIKKSLLICVWKKSSYNNHLRRSDHITDALVCLHWLRVPERVQYKIAVLVYKVSHWLAPQYFGLLNYVADLPGRQPLRSAGTNRLAVPPVKLTTVANQPGFPSCRPTDMERSARRRDFSRIVIHLPSAS